MGYIYIYIYIMEYKNGNNIYGMLMRYQWDINGRYLMISLYPPLIKCGRLENPRTKWRFPASKFIELNGRFSGTLCLITGGYIICFHHVSSIRGSFNKKNGDKFDTDIMGNNWGILFSPCCQGTKKETCCSRYIKFSGVVLNPAWTSARLAPPIKFKHQAMWNKWKANKSTKKMTRKNGETKWENLSGK